MTTVSYQVQWKNNLDVWHANIYESPTRALGFLELNGHIKSFPELECRLVEVHTTITEKIIEQYKPL